MKRINVLIMVVTLCTPSSLLAASGASSSCISIVIPTVSELSNTLTRGHRVSGGVSFQNLGGGPSPQQTLIVAITTSVPRNLLHVCNEASCAGTKKLQQRFAVKFAPNATVSVPFWINVSPKAPCNAKGTLTVKTYSPLQKTENGYHTLASQEFTIQCPR